jgi:hypothetical protein
LQGRARQGRAREKGVRCRYIQIDDAQKRKREEGGLAADNLRTGTITIYFRQRWDDGATWDGVKIRLRRKLLDSFVVYPRRPH